MNPAVAPRRVGLLLFLLLPPAACGGGGAPAAPAPAPAPAAGPSSLQPIGSRARAGDGYAAWGLTGRNKTNGPQFRYRRGVPDGLPGAVTRELDGLALWLAELTPDGWLALYRGERGDWRTTDRYRARLYAPDGGVRWDLQLNPFLSRADHVEIQDLRYHDGVLYFNEACATYARDAGGRCSYLVAVEPRAARLIWRSRPRISNDIFLARDGFLVAGYGFTAEPDSVFLLDPGSGQVRDAEGLDSAHSYLEIHGDTLHVVTRERHHRFLLR